MDYETASKIISEGTYEQYPAFESSLFNSYMDENYSKNITDRKMFKLMVNFVLIHPELFEEIS